jgi:uncharacterized protein with von Willebrand factor type A (vWA) domain
MTVALSRRFTCVLRVFSTCVAAEYAQTPANTAMGPIFNKMLDEEGGGNTDIVCATPK